MPFLPLESGAMEGKIVELTGCVDDGTGSRSTCQLPRRVETLRPPSGQAPGATPHKIDRMFGIVEEQPKSDARTPLRIAMPRQIAVRPLEPARPRGVLIDRLFAAVGRAWNRVWNPKLLGEKAELLFMYEAVRRGLIVSKPFGDSAPYDAVVESRKNPGKVWRVQVRSTSYQNKGWYMVRTDSGSQRRVLTPKDADILAVHITPENVWYIIPIEAYGGKLAVYFSPHKKRRWRKPGYERFREAWGLIAGESRP